MLLWLGFAVLAAVAVAALVRPLMRPADAADSAAAADVAVYRDQLNEIEAERERGLIADGDAEAARAEIGRRLLARAESGGTVAPSGQSVEPLRVQALHPFAAVVAALIPIAGVSIYLAAGRPDLPAQPHATRIAKPAGEQGVEHLIAKVEERLRNKPDDGEGWDVIAPVYMRMGRAADAQQAYARAMAILGETPKRLMGFGEAAMVADNGIVSDAARHAFERVVALEPDRAEARIWLAFALEQDGKSAEAKAAYKDLLARFPGESPWRGAVEERLATLENGKAPGGPSAADVSRAESMSAADRQAQIERMVDGLAARLKADGKDLNGWQRLVQSYIVLGRKQDAVAALGSARSNFAGDGGALAELDKLAKGLGL